MTLVDELRLLRARVLSELSDAHDYYTETLAAWKIVEEVIDAGRTLAIRSTMTGTITTHVELPDKARRYSAEQLPEATFQQFISLFESFLFDLLRLWLSAHPRSLVEKMMPVKDLLDAPDRDFALQSVVDRELVEISYKRPADWFEYLDRRIKLGCPTPDEIERFSEAKATRDVLVHSRGIVGKTYLFKAGRLARFKEGMRIDITDQYHRET
jgi:hypothetical protein